MQQVIHKPKINLFFTIETIAKIIPLAIFLSFFIFKHSALQKASIESTIKTQKPERQTNCKYLERKFDINDN